MTSQDSAFREAQARSNVYRLLAAGFVYPDADFVAALNDGSSLSQLTEALATLSDLEELRGNLEVLCATVGRHAGTLQAHRLQAEYLRLFSGGLHCPHHETDYAASTIFRKADVLADIAGFYRAFGLELSEENRERVDFIGVELEFMHYLAFKEAYAAEQGSQEKVELCREAQRKFLQDHLGPWVEAFQEMVAKNAHDSFYAPLSRLMAQFVERDGRRLGAEPVRVSLSPRREPESQSGT